jgi:hypothetical protein
MRRMLLAFAVVMGFAAMAEANWGTPPVPSQPTGNVYGWNPIFKKVLWRKKDNACSSGQCGGYGHGGPGAGMGNQPQGTLVFPNHPYARSPRDFFMWEAGK